MRFPILDEWYIKDGRMYGIVYNHKLHVDGTKIMIKYKTINLTINQVETSKNMYLLGSAAAEKVKKHD